MEAFFAGIVFGGLFTASVAVIFVTRAKRRKREIEIWTDEAYQAPTVTTRILSNKRSYEL